MLPKISLLMANYNYAKYIKQAIESVLNQSSPDWELIIVDDCSTDNSLEIIKPYLKDERIKLIQHKKNQGYASALKTAVENSSAKILGRIDADDALHKDAVKIMVKAHKDNPNCGLIYSNYWFCNEKLGKKRKGLCKEIPKGKSALDFRWIVSHFDTYKKSAYNKIFGFDPKIKKSVDSDIIFKLEEVTKLKFINKFLYYYRVHPNSLGSKKAMLHSEEWEFVNRYNALKRRNKKYQLAIITSYLGIGGVENVIFTLANFLDDIFNIKFITMSSRKEEVQQKFKSVGEVIHMHDQHEIYSYLLKNNIDLAFTPNGGIEEYLKEKKFPFIKWRAKDDGDALSNPSICIDPDISKPGWIYIPDPIDIGSIQKQKTKRIFGKNEVVIGIATRLSKIKNLDLLINSVSNLQSKNKDIRLLIMGAESKIDDGGIRYTKEEIEKKCKNLLIKGSFKILFDIENTIPHIKGMDITVCTSNNEGLPIFLLEAAACKKPIVSTDVGYISNLIENGKNGFLIESNNQDLFCLALKKLLKDYLLMEKMGKIAYKAVEKHDIKIIGPIYRKIFLKKSIENN